MNNLPNYERWSNYSNLDSKLRDEMNRMNEKDLYDYYQKVINFNLPKIVKSLHMGYKNKVKN